MELINSNPLIQPLRLSMGLLLPRVLPIAPMASPAHARPSFLPKPADPPPKSVFLWDMCVWLGWLHRGGAKAWPGWIFLGACGHGLCCSVCVPSPLLLSLPGRSWSEQPLRFQWDPISLPAPLLTALPNSAPLPLQKCIFQSLQKLIWGVGFLGWVGVFFV